MTVDFDRIIDRTNTNAIPTGGFRRYLFDDPDLRLPCPDDQAMAMWVADMAFATAPVAVGWCRRHYGWSPALEHCLPAHPGLRAVRDRGDQPGL